MAEPLPAFTIRRAVREDCPVILELVRGLAEYERRLEDVTVTLEHFTDSGFGANPVWWAFVAEVDSVVRGFALYFIRYSSWTGQKLYLEDLYVEPEFRGRGIGTGLFSRCIEEAKALNMKALVWQVLDWNEPAKRFYRKFEGCVIDTARVNFFVPPERL
jgi:GNAT superfamily N-acetyltransferase